MKYNWQVVAHAAHYPSSVLFEHYEEALAYYNNIKSVDHDDGYLVTICKIEHFKGNTDIVNPEYEWYLDTYEWMDYCDFLIGDKDE